MSVCSEAVERSSVSEALFEGHLPAYHRGELSSPLLLRALEIQRSLGNGDWILRAGVLHIGMQCLLHCLLLGGNN